MVVSEKRKGHLSSYNCTSVKSATMNNDSGMLLAFFCLNKIARSPKHLDDKWNNISIYGKLSSDGWRTLLEFSIFEFLPFSYKIGKKFA
jgi:hypothetical protein